MGARIQRAATQLLLLAVAFCIGFTPPAHALHTTYVHEAGRLLGQRYPNGLTTVFKYDSLGDLSAIEFNRKDAAGFTLDDITAGATPYWSRTPKASLVYTRDFAGQRRRSLDLLPQVNVADGTPLKRQFQHQYDSGHRLITEWVATDTTAGTAFTLGTDFNAAPSSANLATVAYAMNLVGNRGSRTKTVSGTDPLGAAVAVSVGTYAYDNQDRATTVGALAPTWDARDNALNPGYGKTYGWDRRNRLVKVTAGTVTTLGYDAEGLRVSKQVGGGSVTNYLVDTFSPTGYPQVLVEYTGTGAGRQPQRTYTYGLDLISQRTVAGGLVEFFSNDALGTTRFLTRFDPGVTSLDGQLGELTTQTFTYDAYGLLASGSAAATAYLYTGEQWDNDVGAYYLRARWYLPEWGRFLSRDAIEGTPIDPLSLHKYLYCSDDPVNRIDPSGLADFNIASLTASIGTIMARAANTAINVLPIANRITIALYEGISGSTVAGGAGLLAGGKVAVTVVGGATKFIDPIAKASTEKIALLGFKEAGKYGVWPFKILEKLVPVGSGLQKHHLVEKRFANTLGVAADEIPSIALTAAEHSTYSARWLAEIGRRNMDRALRTDNATIENIWESARVVYQDSPELLEFVKVFLGK